MSNKSNYRSLSDYWASPNEKKKESYFVSYAVRGPMMIPSMGLEAGLPINHPISGPVNEPSPLNNRYLYSRPWPKSSF